MTDARENDPTGALSLGRTAPLRATGDGAGDTAGTSRTGEPWGAAHLAPGTVISRYRVESVLGQGGMGTVYLARQEKPDREVALKVVRPGYATEKMLRRFEYESEVLGRLLHPGIAQIYEAGTADAGCGPQPFFAMELVKGVSLMRYAGEKNLSTRDRLELVAKVCDAVQHAHQKGVIHRDLKPGNILVDESGQPKILDFGVARATDSDIQQTTLRTDVGAIVGTIPYMSPEQVGGDPGELDTRSDVYALGVIAYELLVGRLPYDLERKMIHEAVRIIKEDEPTRLSSIDRSLRGDVETIVAHALEKDKARRYGAASAMGADIRRYLGNEPIAARPASTWYQAAKFAKRNVGLVSGLAATFLVLALGIVATTWEARQVEKARNAAVAERDNAARAEAEARAQLGQTLAREARLARVAGDWPRIISNVDQAIREGVPDPCPLLMLRLEAIAASRPAELPAEAARLLSRPDLGQYRGRVLLFSGEFQSGTPASPADTSALIRQAMDAGLPPAESSYAAALLSRSVPEAIANLQACLAEDPYFHRAATFLTNLLVVSGDAARAEDFLSARQAVEPNNRGFGILNVVLLAMKGDRKGALAVLDRARPMYDPALMDQLHALVGGSPLEQGFERALWLEPERSGTATLLSGLTFEAAAIGLLRNTTQAETPSLSPLLGRLMATTLQSLPTLASQDREGARRVTKQLYELMPSPITGALFSVAWQGSRPYEDFAAAADVARQCAERYGPNPFRRPTIWAGHQACVQLFLRARSPEERKSARASMRWFGRELCKTGPLNPSFACDIAWGGELTGDRGLVFTALQDWREWTDIDSTKAMAAASYLMSRKEYANAFFVAECALRLDPGNARLTEARDKAMQAALKNPDGSIGRLLRDAGVIDAAASAQSEPARPDGG